MTNDNSITHKHNHILQCMVHGSRTHIRKQKATIHSFLQNTSSTCFPWQPWIRSSLYRSTQENHWLWIQRTANQQCISTEGKLPKPLKYSSVQVIEILHSYACTSIHIGVNWTTCMQVHLFSWSCCQITNPVQQAAKLSVHDYCARTMNVSNHSNCQTSMDTSESRTSTGNRKMHTLCPQKWTKRFCHNF